MIKKTTMLCSYIAWTSGFAVSCYFFNETDFSVDFDVGSTLPLSLLQCNRRKHLRECYKTRSIPNYKTTS